MRAQGAGYLICAVVIADNLSSSDATGSTTADGAAAPAAGYIRELGRHLRMIVVRYNTAWSCRACLVRTWTLNELACRKTAESKEPSP